MAPNIQEKFNALGYHFEGIAENQRIKNERGETIAEIDEQTGDTVKIDVPEGFDPKEW